MDITINIPGLDALAAAINNLASAYGGAPVTGGVKHVDPPKIEKGKESKAKVADAAGSPGDGDPAASNAALGAAETTEVAPVSLTPDDVKKMAAKLTQVEGGNDKLKALFEQFGAKKFSEVPTDKLGDFAQALVKAGVPLPTAA